MDIQPINDDPSGQVTSIAPRLPPELCDMVLDAATPRSTWRARGVCRRWESYVIDVLALRKWLPRTSIYLRGSQSWVFWPGSSAQAKENRTIFPNGAHFGFVSSSGECAVAFFEPRSGSLAPVHHLDLIMKMEDEVQVILYLPFGETIKHIRLPSLTLVDRDRLTLAVAWKELFVRAFAATPTVHAPTLKSDMPSVLWVAADEDGVPGRWWSVSDDEGDSTTETESDIGHGGTYASGSGLQKGESISFLSSSVYGELDEDLWSDTEVSDADDIAELEIQTFTPSRDQFTPPYSP